MKDQIICKARYVGQLECSQEWQLAVKRHGRSIGGPIRRSPSLLVRILAIWNLRLPPLQITLTIGRILTLNTLKLSRHRLPIGNVWFKRLLSLLTLDIWIWDLLS